MVTYMTAFDPKNFLSLFFTILSSKILVCIRIRIRSGVSDILDPDPESAKCLELDPDPYSVNPDPKRWKKSHFAIYIKKNCNIFLLRPPYWPSKLLEEAVSSLKRKFLVKKKAFSANVFRSRVAEPYNKIKQGTRSLERLQTTADILR
jgi:hypothetical protein